MAISSDALGVCGADRMAQLTPDADGDGVCDDIDACVGTLDECGICNGPVRFTIVAADYSGRGDCDCDGNQLDAIGVVVHDCTLTRMRWICDDVDACVGTLDECGICNGPGAIYDCGCDISAGDCDCDGNQLDALDVCRLMSC